ncbi:MAG: hypothetical protein WEB58_11010 [Planctomycetaceae bacterium]
MMGADYSRGAIERKRPRLAATRRVSVAERFVLLSQDHFVVIEFSHTEVYNEVTGDTATLKLYWGLREFDPIHPPK